MRHRLYFIVWFGLGPMLFYLACFILLTYPLIRTFTTHIFAGPIDGLQNYWNIWWVNKAITQLHTSPWFTTQIQYPHGTTLIGHTLNPINGIMAIPLLRLMPLNQVYNLIVVFSFVASGYTLFLLAYRLTQHYEGSVIAGFIFTFSHYHFTHLLEHLQLTSLEWIPLFLLSFLVFTERPTPFKGIVTAVLLFLILLTDYYYFFYAAVCAGVALLWLFSVRRLTVADMRHNKIPWIIFFAVSVLLTAPLLFHLIQTHLVDPLLGSHDPSEYSLDLMAPFIPGVTWRFADLTRMYWSELGRSYFEASVYVGWSVILLILYAAFRKRTLVQSHLTLFYILCVVFFLLSLGPMLRIGTRYTSIVLPYEYLTMLFPILGISGVPVRMMAIATLALSVISAYAISALWNNERRWALLLLAPVFILDHLQAPIPSLARPTPHTVQILQNIPGNDPVVDGAYHMSDSLYYQTIHEKPMALGYIARIPTGTERKNDSLRRAIDGNDYGEMRRAGFRFLLTKSPLPAESLCTFLAEDTGVILYDLSTCR
ncbi:MAG: hypothetical protein ACOY3M_00495 [Patescibacteria group bacterium]